MFLHRGIAALVGVALLGFAVPDAHARKPSKELGAITVDYPRDGSLFPSEITPPTFLWHDTAANVAVWQVKVTFASHGRTLRVESRGEKLRLGEIDESFTGFVPPALTAEQETAHAWKPDEKTWSDIKRRSAKSLATVTFAGFSDERMKEQVSQGQVSIRTSTDPVGAPIFYRDVPLIPAAQGEKGIIKPLPESAIPLIQWRLRYINEPRGKVVMEHLPTCANCHSVSLDGKTLGMDVDGPQNDKGLYALIAIKPQASMRAADVINWNRSEDRQFAQSRVGFMSQVSPDGRYVVTTISGTARPMQSNFYVTNFKDYRFLQVFYPTAGILAWYDRTTGVEKPLPGADDPHYVQTDGVWSPDGKYLVFARAEARTGDPSAGKKAEYANDPAEFQIQYNLYRVPFNEGRGGQPERIVGASDNGMSNNFPKVSPDGRWIVFVKCKNGQLMRPDSQLFIVPAQGGEARPLASNLPVMNSWHSFSPNGRWLVFSSKGRSYYTQMFLTHLDEAGNTTPAILIDDATAANRAVNIPEFMNIGTAPGALDRIDPEATEFYRLFNVAATLEEKDQYDEAIAAWRKALELDANDARAHRHLGAALAAGGKLSEAVQEFRRSIEIEPNAPTARENFGIALARLGRLDEAIEQMQKAAELNPNDARTHSNLGGAFAQAGRMNDAIEQCQAAIQLDPNLADAYNNLGFALSATNRLDEAAESLRRAVELDPNSEQYRSNLRRVLAMQAGSSKH